MTAVVIIGHQAAGSSRLNLYNKVKADPEPAHTIGSTPQEKKKRELVDRRDYGSRGWVNLRCFEKVLIQMVSEDVI